MKCTDKFQRLACIDFLRGLDMFFLVGAGDVLRHFFGAFHSETFRSVLYQLDHHWTGFTAWDIIMPLFLFTSGLSMPFSFEKFLASGHTRKQLYGKIFKRFLILFVLGWIAQGRLLDLNINTFHIYCNTLHSIAFGYLITAVIVLNINKLKSQIIVAMSLVVTYGLLLHFAGGGDFSKEGNFAMRIDKLLLGRFIDGTHQYTWVLSSLGFGATVLSGYFAGYALKQGFTVNKTLKTLIVTGVALIASGLLLSLQSPIIKPIWSPSMILLSSGICYLLLAFCFLITDVGRFNGWWVTGLKIFGMNSIVAYMIHTTIRLRGISEYLLHGFEQFTGAFFPAIVSLGEFALLFFILWHLYKQKIFIKV